ncbi:MAG: TIM barrel protein [Spirochaetales bacterium]|nr:TIM barrel protein [Spirochaetales bacterium]
MDQVIALTQKAELKAIEWAGDKHVPPGDEKIAQVTGEKTRAAGLKILSYGSYYRTGPVKEGKENPDFKDVLLSARALGAQTIRIWAGWCERKEADPALIQAVRDDINRCADLAEGQGLSLSYEYHRNTFTGTDESARLLAEEIDRPNVKFYWQPPHHNSDKENLAGIESLIERITHLHVFHWLPLPQGKNDRRLLEEGKLRWQKFLDPFAQLDQERGAFLEFCREGKEENFLRDAKTLKEILSSLRA